MFDFLFKRSAKKQPKTQQGPATPPEQQAAAAREQRQAEGAVRKQQAREQLATLGRRDEALVDFIRHCEFADIRLEAAELLQGREALEAVQQAMRNSDRRVAKHLQARLRALDEAEGHQCEIESLLATARELEASPTLALNKVAELDQRWARLPRDPAAEHQFGEVRTRLGERLQAQADLQRALAQALAEVRAMSAAELAPDELQPRLEQLAAEVAVYTASDEAHVLSRTLLAQFAQEYGALHASLENRRQRQAALAQREALLDEWEAAAPDTLEASELRKRWGRLPALPDDVAAEVERRFRAVLQRLQRLNSPAPAAVPEQPQLTGDARTLRKVFNEALEALENAVQEGQLHQAAAQDRTLRGLDPEVVKPNAEQWARLNHARGELTRLRDWARWGGNVSREELIRVVEELPAQELGVTELGKRVGTSRERWKLLDATSGPAPRALWERFDAACTAAWAPVAEHYRQLAEERQHNQAQAQGLIDDARQYGQTALAADSPDWKAITAFIREVRQAWKRLGPVERRERRTLDAAFEAAVEPLVTALQRAREQEIARREQLITEATQLAAQERASVESLRTVQARWAELARLLPLERKDEQALWQRFRAACDEFFARRKAVAEAADSERQANLQAGEALCTRLEAGLGQSVAAVRELLNEAEPIWRGLGQVPRAAEAALEQRYQAAVNALRDQVDAERRARQQALGQALRDKLRVCVDLEQRVAATPAPAAAQLDALQQKWQALPAVAGETERGLQQRFTAAVAAATGDREVWLGRLKDNRSQLLRELLRQEIMAGVDSPADQAAERLRLQVEVLQDSLRSGEKPAARRSALLALCVMPALTEKAELARLEALLEQVA